MSEKISRRKFIGYGIGGAVVAAIAAGAGTYYFTQQTRELPTLRGYVHAIDPNAMTAAAVNKWNAEYGAGGTMGEIANFTPIAMPAGGAQDITYKTEASLLEAKSPDLDCPNIDISWPAVMAENGWLEPLDDIFPPEEQKKFVPGCIEAVTWKRTGEDTAHVYAIPYFPDELGIWYRKDIFDDNGITVPDQGLGWTWDEFYDILVNLKDKYPDMYPMANDLAKTGELMNSWSIQMFTAGAGLFDDDGLVRINDPAGITAAKSLYKLKELDLLHPEFLSGGLEVARITFTDEGKAITHEGWDYVWGMSEAPESTITGNVGRAIAPHQPGAKGGMMIGGWEWAISAASRKKKEAKEFVKWMTSFDTMKFIMMGQGFSQARLAVYEDAEVQQQWPHAPIMKKGFENSFPKFKTIHYPRIQTVVQDQMHACLSGQKSPEDAQNAIADEVMKITGKGQSPLVKR